MKLENPKITMLVNREYTEITIEDTTSNTRFIRVKLSAEQLSLVLSRMGSVDCECEVEGLDVLGKTHENKYFEFEIPSGIKGTDEDALIFHAKQLLLENSMSEWIPDRYFRSQNSFFKKDGKEYARCVIRRWV